MPRLSRMIVALLLVFGMAAVASAEPLTAADQEKVAKASNSAMAANAAIGMGLAAVGIGIGLGLACFGTLSGMARQPGLKGDLQTFTYIIGGLVEGSGIIAMVLCFVTVLMLK